MTVPRDVGTEHGKPRQEPAPGRPRVMGDPLVKILRSYASRFFRSFNFSLSVHVALTSVCPNKGGLVVQSNKNYKAAVFFAAFFLFIYG